MVVASIQNATSREPRVREFNYAARKITHQVIQLSPKPQPNKPGPGQ